MAPKRSRSEAAAALSEAPASSRPVPKRSKAATTLAERKMKQVGLFQTSPFPSFAGPTEAACAQVAHALEKEHGKPPQREQMRFEDDEEGAPQTDRGLADGIVDTVIRTILGLNTNARNYRVSKRGLDDRFGYGDYNAIQKAPLEEIVEALRAGGLSNVKGKAIKTILDDLHGRVEGTSIRLRDSLEHLHDLDDTEAMRELLSLHGVGPKAAACVLSYALGREIFAIDTHIFRITKALRWIPADATREQAHAHFNARIPARFQYDLHLLFIQHGRACKDCTAVGVTAAVPVTMCPLKPFLHGKRPTDIENKEEEEREKEKKEKTREKKREVKEGEQPVAPKTKKPRRSS